MPAVRAAIPIASTRTWPIPRPCACSMTPKETPTTSCSVAERKKRADPSGYFKRARYHDRAPRRLIAPAAGDAIVGPTFHRLLPGYLHTMALPRPRLSLRSSLLLDGLAVWLWRHRSEATAVARSLPNVIRRARADGRRAALGDFLPVAKQARSIDRSRRAISGRQSGLADRISRLRPPRNDRAPVDPEQI